jgi:agmatine deiminase
MKNKLLLFLVFFFFQNIIIQAQNDEILPRGFSKKELLEMGDNHSRSPNGTNFSDPPPGEVRTMAEWEELQGLVISWTGNGNIKDILEEIIRYAKEEVEVYIVCSSSAVVINQLPSDISLDNITFVETPFNSIWVRDYGPNTVYVNDVDFPYMIDWIYNRNRPADDTLVPPAIAAILDIPIYETSDCDNNLDLVHTGGNFMNDGMGRAFSSKLVLDENSFPNNQYGCNYQTEDDVLSIMDTFMGIDEYVFMENLIYDPIDHIDMHVKLLDEETLLVGEYPAGVADGPQIEANLQYVLNNYMTPYGRPYDVIRVPMPPDNGNYPDSNPPGDYRTYANAVFVNKTVLLPIYEEEYDTTAIRIWEEALPGYKIKGINCNDIIGLNGAIHCITKEVGVKEPLLINHSKVREGCTEQDQVVEATVQHKTGIAEVTLFYSTDTSGTYQTLVMTNTIENTWSAMIPATNEETEMFYYIQATANDGKQINRPIVAPKGYFHYDVIDCMVATEDLAIGVSLENIYPNPASAITVIPVKTTKSLEAEIVVSDFLGRTIETIFFGKIPAGENNYFIHADKYAAGTYFVNLKTEEKIFVQKLIIQ